MVTINGKTYTLAQLAKLIEAVEFVLVATDDCLKEANCQLLDTAIEIGIVTDEECFLV